MLSLLLRRAGLGLMVALTVSLLCFVLSNVAVDPALALAGDSATEADLQALRVRYALDKPLPERYAAYLGRLLAGDLGTSQLTGEPVSRMLADRVGVTALLALTAILVALAVAVPAGVMAAAHRGGWADRVVSFVTAVVQAMPSFWAALLLIIFFGVKLRWLPISGSGTLAHYVMPTVALSLYALPALTRLTRSGMVQALESDYIRTARAMGLPTRVILFKSALRNALLPVVSLGAVQFGFMLGGSIVIESIFAIHGIGYLAWQSMIRADMPVIQAVVLMISLTYIVLTFLSDVLNTLLDPRLKRAAS
ncbi:MULTISPECIES: ABC transporter permease [Achromobacter]|uniref:ABC transporter permease n=1 Tax=Achromobacter TaxID=222 RepID=UPI0006BFCBFD|nr:ABC transporter permease [Achromobacter kerstersii]CUJ52341.1 Glutathione transport system permease protein gsiC [Achromobacter kerstersii]